MLRNRIHAVLASAAVLAASLALTFSLAARAGEATPAAPAETAKPATESPLPDMAVGKEDAPVTIVEYSSLTCPHCAHFHKDVFPELKSQYIDTGKVRYV